MNEASKSKWANLLTGIVAVIAFVQGIFTNPPFPSDTVEWATVIFMYLTLALTAWKQYLSPDVSNTGQQVTLWAAVAITIGGLVNFFDLVTFPEQTEAYIRWAISGIVAAINIWSKSIFPSQKQEQRMNELKYQS
jgi:hypothetical protein